MQQSAKFWDRVATKSNGNLGKITQKTIEKSSRYFTPNSVVLDFGCGNGVFTNAIAPKVKEIIGTDISKKMLEAAIQLSKENNQTNTIFRHVDLLKVDFENEVLDVILAFNVLHYIQDLDIYLTKMNQLLKSNGVLICSTVCLKEKRSLARILMYLFSKIRILPPISFYTRSGLETKIKARGFDHVESILLSSLPEYFMVFRKKQTTL